MEVSEKLLGEVWKNYYQAKVDQYFTTDATRKRKRSETEEKSEKKSFPVWACQRCGGEDFVNDYISGDYICSSCGVCSPGEHFDNFKEGERSQQRRKNYHPPYYM